MNWPEPRILDVGSNTEGYITGTDYSLHSSAPKGSPEAEHIRSRYLDGVSQVYFRGNKIISAGPRFNTFDDRLPSPDFFKYGISYKPSESDGNCFRTVHIGNLPRYIHANELLDQIRGGMVVKATINNTTSITGSMSALVIFVSAKSAHEYSEYAKQNPIRFRTHQAEITLVKSHTWPMHEGLRKAIFNLGRTRCLKICKFPVDRISIENVVHDISHGYSYRASAISKIYVDDDATMHIEFASVAAAGSAYGCLTRYRAYKDMVVEFKEDPCDGPVHELRAIAEAEERYLNGDGIASDSDDSDSDDSFGAERYTTPCFPVRAPYQLKK